MNGPAFSCKKEAASWLRKKNSTSTNVPVKHFPDWFKDKFMCVLKHRGPKSKKASKLLQVLEIKNPLIKEKPP